MLNFISHNLLNKCLFPLHLLVFGNNMLMPSELLFTSLCLQQNLKEKHTCKILE